MAVGYQSQERWISKLANLLQDLRKATALWCSIFINSSSLHFNILSPGLNKFAAGPSGWIFVMNMPWNKLILNQE